LGGAGVEGGFGTESGVELALSVSPDGGS